MEPGGGPVQTAPDGEDRAQPDAAWEAARKRLEAKRGFASHLASYVVVNACFVAIWAATGAGYFWPAWVLGSWGIGLVMHGWDTCLRRPITDADIEAELRRRDR
jgi:hypothetical protein